MSFNTIWETLHKADIKPLIENKGNNLSYISWAKAWSKLMEHFPSAVFSVLEPKKFDDGTVEVWCEVNIEGYNRVMWLPVMDYRNNPIPNPNARQVSDTRMRCLVKCLAMFGLGIQLYSGEDLPDPSKDKPVEPKADPLVVKTAASAIVEYITAEDYSEDEKLSSISEIWSELSEAEKKAAWVAKTKGGFFSQEHKEFIRKAAALKTN